MNQISIKCLNCLNDFLGKPNKKFCSTGCKNHYNDQKRKEKKENKSCKVCNKKFTPTRKCQIYCGITCRNIICNQNYKLRGRQNKTQPYMFKKIKKHVDFEALPNDFGWEGPD